MHGGLTLIRKIAFGLFLVLGVFGHASGQDWARKMFKKTDHDFGAVARGAKSEVVFEFENIYEETLHISGVRASCGCTTPSLSKDTIKTWEKGAVIATLNTQSFLGYRTATITMTFDRPFFAEVQFNIQAHVRSDVVLSPGQVDFGSIEQGKESQRKVAIHYAGRQDWKIVDVRSGNPHVEVELQETQRAGGRVAYDMMVFLKPDAPGGYLNDQLVLVTDDPKLSQVPVQVEGRIVAPLSVSPASLFLGVLSPGQSVTKQLVVRGKEPFRIKQVRCGDERFEFTPSDQLKILHTLPVRFTANTTTGKVAETIEIETDLGGTLVVSCLATATIVDKETRSSKK